AALHMSSVQPLNVLLIENRFHGFDRLERLFDLIHQIALKNSGVNRRLVRILFENVPSTEHQVSKRRNRDEILDQRNAVFGSLAQSNRSHLRERSDRLGKSAFNRFDTCNERSAYGSQPDKQHPKFALRLVDQDVSLLIFGRHRYPLPESRWLTRMLDN